MEEKEKNTTPAATEAGEPSKVEAEYVSVPTEQKKGPKVLAYIISVVVVVIIVLGVLYFLEKEGRSSTNLFGGVIENQQATVPVAIVNGQKIAAGELEIGISQFEQAAVMQGMDVTDPEAAAEIREQALQVLINTELLTQKAEAEGLVVSEEEVTTRYDEVVTSLGGEEALGVRLEELGLDNDRLVSDIQTELLIQKLLDTVYVPETEAVEEAEVLGIYTDAGGEEAGLPPLEEVRGQIEAQILAMREQTVIQEYIDQLREAAEIEIVE